MQKKLSLANRGRRTARARKGYAAWVILVILGYRECEGGTYRSVVDQLKMIGPIWASLELDQRSTVESVIRVVKRHYGDRLTSRTWYGQFRELAIKLSWKT